MCERIWGKCITLTTVNCLYHFGKVEAGQQLMMLSC